MAIGSFVGTRISWFVFEILLLVNVANGVKREANVFGKRIYVSHDHFRRSVREVKDRRLSLR